MNREDLKHEILLVLCNASGYTHDELAEKILSLFEINIDKNK